MEAAADSALECGAVRLFFDCITRSEDYISGFGFGVWGLGFGDWGLRFRFSLLIAAGLGGGGGGALFANRSLLIAAGLGSRFRCILF